MSELNWKVCNTRDQLEMWCMLSCFGKILWFVLIAFCWRCKQKISVGKTKKAQWGPKTQKTRRRLRSFQYLRPATKSLRTSIYASSGRSCHHGGRFEGSKHDPSNHPTTFQRQDNIQSSASADSLPCSTLGIYEA